MLEATRQLWRIQLDPEDRSRDAAFDAAVTAAITAAEAWTTREPRQAEAWFYLGGAYGARVQWRVLRQERLGAARDGREVKNALDRTLALAPGLVDAQFGLGLYEYYADIAPTAAKILRVLMMLPGGDRARGLARMQRTRQTGQLLADEAAFQLHVVYFWYENRAADALALLGELVRRHPRNPYFRRAIADAEAVYLHDTSASLASWRELARLADTNAVNEGALARPDAHLGYATALDALGDTDLALAELTRLRASAPLLPWGITNRIALALGRVHDRLGQRAEAEALLRQVVASTARNDPLGLGDAARRVLQRPTPEPKGRAHRLGLEAWRAFTADAVGAGAAALRGGDRARSGQRRHAAALRARAGGAAADRAGDRRARRGARSGEDDAGADDRRGRAPRRSSARAAARSRQRDRRVSTRGRDVRRRRRDAQRRDSRDRAPRTIAIGPAVSLKFRRRCADILEHHPLI